jgi:hypothetical protein
MFTPVKIVGVGVAAGVGGGVGELVELGSARMAQPTRKEEYGPVNGAVGLALY